MQVTLKGTHLRFTEIDRKILDMSRELPGRRRFRDGELLVESSGENLAVVLARFPELAEAPLEPIQKFLGVRAAEKETLLRKSLPAEAAFFNFKTQPYEHQLKAFGLCRHAEYFGLFMEMGTGKSKILIDNAFSLYAEGHIDRVIVMSLNGVHRQWVEQQIPEHAPDYPWDAHAYYSGMGVKATRGIEAAMADKSKLQWFTMAFESLASKKAQEMVLNWIHDANVMLILDESQKIKNPSAARTKFLLKVSERVAYRRIATGTEVTQGVEDLFTQMKFLNPHILGHSSFYSFRNEYCRVAPIPNAPVGAYRIVGYQNLDKLKERVSGCTYQVLKKDCLDLPDKVYKQHLVEFTAEQRKAYDSMKKYMVSVVGEGKVVEAPIALTMLMKLQQITSGHLIDDEGVTHPLKSNRPGAVLDILEDRKKAIVWARFVADIEMLRKVLIDAGYTVGVYAGGTSEEERRRIVKPGEVDVLIANQQSAGAGLNLTHFDTAIYYSNSFSAADRWQSEDRIHRIGQTNKCLYVDLFSPDSVDGHIIKALQKKASIRDQMREPTADLEEGPEELLRDVLGV